MTDTSLPIEAEIDPIEQIEINYKYHSVYIPDPDDEYEEDLLEETYTERLFIDRLADILVYSSMSGSNRLITKLTIEGNTEVLFRALDQVDLFAFTKGNPPDALEFPDETLTYTITVVFRDKPPRVLSGSFDKRGLPEDWTYFAGRVSGFIHSGGQMDILTPYLYERTRPSPHDLIYCSVEFESSSKSYYYRTEDRSIQIGDFVVVPAGKDNRSTIVQVVDIEYFSEEDVPLPLDKTKSILRKCTEEELDDGYV